MTQKKTIKDFNWKIGIKVFGLCTLIGSGYAYASQRYVVGLDTQDHRCLDEWFYVIDTWKKPAADDVDRNDYIAVVLTADQTPANAKWAPGHVMVKRAVATPGDVVSINEDGAEFTRGLEHWHHGSGLEAATALGMTPDALKRQITLSEDELFLMGDNDMSYDGRYYGQVNEQQIVGSVIWAF